MEPFKKIGENEWEVETPDPTKQHLKNPVMELVKVGECEDPETGKKVDIEKLKPKVLRVRDDGTPEHEMGGEPKWGFGCPERCGRFWWFLPDGEGGWEPKDPQAFMPNENTVSGYLDWKGDGRFTCDRCGVKIRLVRR